MNAKLQMYKNNQQVGLEYASGERKVYELIKHARECAKKSVISHKNGDWDAKSNFLSKSYEILHVLLKSLEGESSVKTQMQDMYNILLYWLTEALKKPQEFEAKMEVFDTSIRPLEDAWFSLAFKEK